MSVKPATFSMLFGLVIAASIVASAHAQSHRDGDHGQADRLPLLKARVTHSEFLMSVPAGLKPGSAFDLSSFPNIKSDLWYSIPSWLAGTWHEDYTTLLCRIDCKSHRKIVSQPETIKIDGGRTFGQQRAKDGTIWQAVDHRPISGRLRGFIRYSQMQIEELVEKSDKRVVFKTVNLRVDVNRDTGAVMQTFQSENITIYKYLRDGLLELDDSAKAFAPDGQPLDIVESKATANRTGPFGPMHYAIGTGADLELSFNRYLVEHGLSNLSPQGGP